MRMMVEVIFEKQNDALPFLKNLPVGSVFRTTSIKRQYTYQVCTLDEIHDDIEENMPDGYVLVSCIEDGSLLLFEDNIEVHLMEAKMYVSKKKI